MPTRRELANVLRVLAMDAVQKANSGHAGAPMGMADIAEVLWRDFLKYNPGNPLWWDRDRFILSNGHACMLLYAMLYLTGYDMSLDDISSSASGIRRPRAIPNITTSPVLRSRPAHSDKALRTRLAWPSPSAGSRRSFTRATTLPSTTASTPSAAMAT